MAKHKKFSPDQLLNNPLLNKGSAFTQKERDAFGLNGLLPYQVSTMEQQLQRRYANFSAQKGALAKYTFLSALQNRNEVLFYRLVQEHIDEMMPLVYTPTVGEVSLHFSVLYKEHRGVYISYPHKDKMHEIIRGLKKEVDVIVVTDGERILGLGDLGVGGMTIPLGKLVLYTIFGGINPAKTLPVFLDVGTNNETLLDDPLYMGWRNKRISGKEYDNFIHQFVKEIKKKYPNVLLQWEDFAKPHAKPLLEKYREKICSFNDDIQGTAAVVLSAILAGVKAKKESLEEQRVVIFGGGGAGLGIARYIAAYSKHIYVVDRHGLITTKLKEADKEQKKFAQSWDHKDTSLLNVIRQVRPHILIGVSGQAGSFTEEMIKEMAKQVEKPLIFPLSNPNSCCEAKPADLMEWTQGKAIIATGSPFEGIAQCNNVYIFPGVGLGVLASGAKTVPDSLFYKAAEVLSSYSPMLKSGGALFPRFKELHDISKHIAVAVAQKAQEEGIAKKMTPEETMLAVEKTMWQPEYESLY